MDSELLMKLRRDETERYLEEQSLGAHGSTMALRVDLGVRSPNERALTQNQTLTTAEETTGGS